MGRAGDEAGIRPFRRWASRGALIAAVLVLAAACGSSGTSAGTTTTTSSTTSSSTTSTSVAGAPPAEAVFPTGTDRYADPVAAAKAFATSFAGFASPVVGEFRQGDTQSGEVEVRPRAQGPVTTVIVRRIGGSWWVLGASTPNLVLDQPAAGATIASPVRLTGTSTAYEGTILWALRGDGRGEPLAHGFATGGANGDMGPFATEATFTPPTGATGGAIVLSTESAQNGEVWEVTVVRVHVG